MKLTLPYPPTANKYWRVFRGRAVKSAEAREYQRQARLLFMVEHCARSVCLSGPVAVYVKAYRPRKLGDLDNTLKVALDALKGLAFEDDSQIVAINAERHEDKENPRLEIEVLPIGIKTEAA